MNKIKTPDAALCVSTPQTLEEMEIFLNRCCDIRWEFYPLTKITVFSPGFSKITHCKQTIYDDFEQVLTLLHPNDRSKFHTLLNQALEDLQSSFYEEIRIRRRDGSYRQFAGRCWALGRGPSHAPYVTGLFNDITNFRNQDADLWETQMKNKLFMKSSMDVIWEYDLLHKEFFFSPEFVDALGPENSAALSKKITSFLESSCKELTENTRFSKIFKLFDKKAGRYTWFEITYFVLLDSKNICYKLIGSLCNADEKVRLQEAAYQDELTKVYSRRAAVEQLEKFYQDYRKNRHNCAVLFLDLDDFKMVNDTYGHAAGDLVLQAFADRLQQALSPFTGTAYRWGGEEFLALCPLQSEHSTIQWAQQFRRLIEGMTIPWKGNLIQITVSIGISVFTQSDEDCYAGVWRADDGVYQIKSQGKNGVCFIPGAKE